MSLPEIIFASLLPALGFAFGAGRIVESIKKEKYTSKEVCEVLHKDLSMHMQNFADDLKAIKEKLGVN